MRHIGIGIGEDHAKVLGSIAALPDHIHIQIYSLPDMLPDNLHVAEITEDARAAELMIADLVTGQLDAALRGTLPSGSTLRALKEATGVTRLERIVLLETLQGNRFLLAPVGVDEGWSPADRLGLIRRGRDLAVRLGLSSEVGVLSGGRLADVGRHPAVDQSLAAGELLTRISDATHYEIRIEDAARRCGLVIAPDGITGNLIFRTLTLLGSGISHGAPVVNISRVFIDTSRATPSYRNAVLLADFLSKK